MYKLLFIIPITALLIFNCDLFTQQRTLKPYDPEKAGATIVEEFNITNKISITGIPIFPEGVLINSRYDVAEYNNTIYIYNNNKIYIFNKDTFEKIDELVLNIRATYINKGYGMAITSSGNAFLYCPYLLFSINLFTGDSIKINIDEINFENDRISKLGYDKNKDAIWFLKYENNLPYLLFYSYNAHEQEFVFIEQKEAPKSYHEITSIYGDTCWFNGFIYADASNKKSNIGISRYSFINLNQQLHFIDVEYLNTLTLPQSTHYDGEHIWLMVERCNQIQMLKLLPHG